MADTANSLPTMPPPAAPKTSRTLPLVLILTLLSLAISGYLFYQNQQLMKQLAAIQKPTPSPLASPQPVAESPNPTTEWKTYTSKQYGFSIQYPQQFEVNEQILESEVYLSKIDPTKYMSLTEIRYGSNLDQIVIDISYEGEGLDRGSGRAISQTISQEPFSGKNATVRIIMLEPQSNIRIWKIIEIPEFHNFRLECLSPKKDVDLANQILSTFKFTQ